MALDFVWEQYAFELESAVRILLAIVLSGVIGWERGQKKHPAGFRTHVLVCLGSAVIMLLSHYIQQQYANAASFDPQRLGAQVISGIGFLGAGTILKTGNNVVKGLTTAASLWATSCIGLAVGAGAYFLATFAACCIFVVISIFSKLEHRLLYQGLRELHFAVCGNSTKLDEVSGVLGTLGLRYASYRVDPPDASMESRWSFIVHMLLENTGGIPLETIQAFVDKVEGVMVFRKGSAEADHSENNGELQIH